MIDKKRMLDAMLERDREQLEEFERQVQKDEVWVAMMTRSTMAQERSVAALERIAADFRVLAGTAQELESIAASLEKLARCVETVYDHGERFMVRTSKEGGE